MGSGARKREKDFKKPKLKVGKTKPKPSKSTDTSFKSKAIVLGQQSLHVTAPSENAQFQHHISLLSHHSVGQRRNSLNYLTSYISVHGNPLNAAILLPLLLPLTLDASVVVRDQLLKLMRTLPESTFTEDNGVIEKFLAYVRTGLTHLAVDVKQSTVQYFDFLLHKAGIHAITCPGGWDRMLRCYFAMLGWMTARPSSTSASSFAASKMQGGKQAARELEVLFHFLDLGLSPSTEISTQDPCASLYPPSLAHISTHLIPKSSTVYGYLSLFGAPQNAENKRYEDVEERRKLFLETFATLARCGIGNLKHEGGQMGRIAGRLLKLIKKMENCAQTREKPLQIERVRRWTMLESLELRCT